MLLCKRTLTATARKRNGQAAEALKLAPTSQGAESEAPLAFTMAGDTARADALAQGLGKRFPLDTQMQLFWLPAIQTQLSLDRKNPTLALNTLQAASLIELGQIAPDVSISCLSPVYVRGEAYLAARQGIPAADFQKILDHSGIVGNCAGREPWRIWGWPVRMPCSREARTEQTPMLLASAPSPPTKTSSPSVKMPTPTSPS